MMKRILLIAMMLLGFETIKAQSHFRCGTSAVEDAHLASDPSKQLRRQQWLQQAATLQEGNLPKTVYYIPVVFHIMHRYGPENISEAQVNGWMDMLNRDFNKMNADTADISPLFKPLAASADIRFVLAAKDPEGNCTNGIMRYFSPITYGAGENIKKTELGGADAWPTDRYINIWVVGSIADSLQAAAYASMPYNAGDDSYGIVTAYTYISGYFGQTNWEQHILTHEMGHCLGLYHTFDGGCGTSCSTSGDYVCDTPPAIFTGMCAPPGYSGINSCANDMLGAGSPFTSDVPDMLENFMGYSACPRMFTHGQKNRMHATLSSELSLMVSAANASYTGINQPQLCIPQADFYVSTRTVCQGGSVKLQDLSSGASASMQNWHIYNDNHSFHSTNLNPDILLNHPGTYSISYTASNGAGSTTIVRTGYITVMPYLPLPAAPYFVDHMDNYPIGSGRWGTAVKLASNDFGGWQDTDLYGYSNHTSVFVNNYDLKYRGVRSMLYSGGFNITNISEPVITFKVAFAARSGVLSQDTLVVFASRNLGGCAMGLQQIQMITGDELTTTPAQAGPFYPSESNWKVFSAELPTVPVDWSYSTNLRLVFEFRSGGGNNIYLDDINVLPRFSNEENGADVFLSVFPNPAADNVRIESAQGLQNVELLSAEGKLISAYQANSSSFDLNISAVCKPGIYYLRIHSGEQTLIRKIVKL